MAAVATFFGAIFIIVLLASLALALVRAVARFLLAASIAVIAGLLLGAVILPGDPDQVSYSLLLGLALAFPTFALVRGRRPGEPREPDERSLVRATVEVKPPPAATSKGDKVGWLRWRRTAARADAFATAWEKLSLEAAGAENRVSVARRSCERFRAALRGAPLDPEAHSLLVLVEKRIPELIQAALRRLQDSDERQRALILDDLLDVLERFAADCERRQRKPADEAYSEDAVLRAHIEAHLRGTP